MGKQTERGLVMTINVGGGELRELKPRINVSTDGQKRFGNKDKFHSSRGY